LCPTTEITATGTSTKTATVTLTVPKYGKNILWVRAVDSVGNLGNIASKEITVGRPSPPVAQWGLETYPGQNQTQALADAQPTLGDTDGTGPLTANTPLTPTNVTWASDVRLIGGKTASFNGSYLSTSGPVIDTTKSFSVAAWVNLRDASKDRVVVAQLGETRARFILYFSSSRGEWRFYIYDEDGISTAGVGAGGGPATVGKWTHLAGVYDATARKISLYVDGVLTGTSNYDWAWNATGPFIVGRTFVNGSNSASFMGEIADVQVFDRVLVDHDFTGQLKSDPNSGGFDEPGILAPIEVGRWDMEAGVSCYSQDLENTCEAPDGTGFNRWLALSRGSEIGAGYAGGLGLRLDGCYFPEENPPPCEATLEYGWTGKTRVDEGPVVWQDKPVLRTDQSFTVSAWVKMDRTDRYQVVLAQDGSVNSGFYLYYANDGDGVWKFKMLRDATTTDNTGTIAQASAPDAMASWHHLVGILDVGQRQLRLYVNGQRVATQALMAEWQPWQANGPLTVGRAFGTSNLLHGAIDQVRVFQGAMTDAQVKALYDSQVVS